MAKGAVAHFGPHLAPPVASMSKRRRRAEAIAGSNDDVNGHEHEEAEHVLAAH